MNCQEFELIVHEMAREQPLKAETRREGLDHMSACASCARLLAASHSLSLGLRALATESALAEAPAPVETALLAAFERGKQPRTVRGPSRWELSRWALAKWLPAVSAVVVLAVALGIRYWHTPGPTGGTQPTRASGPSTPANANGAQPAGTSKLASGADETGRQGPAAQLASSAAPTATTDSELADFVPLAGFADPLDLEAGEVVRVSLPSSAAADLGLPVMADGEETTIRADVLIAEDGTARAVRIRD